jgi:hypothetical protein
MVAISIEKKLITFKSWFQFFSNLLVGKISATFLLKKLCELIFNLKIIDKEFFSHIAQHDPDVFNDHTSNCVAQKT